jgi:uncharacterized repeat protein (TIGR01451 family)
MMPFCRPGKATSRKLMLPLILLVVMAGLVLSVRAGGPGTIGVTNLERVSLGNGDVEGDGSSFFPYSSYDGRIVAFESWARNWAYDGPSGSRNWIDIFYRDRLTGYTQKITFDYYGQETADNKSVDPTVTYDGRYIVYTSYATNLVPDDTNGSIFFEDTGLDVFMHDRVQNSTIRVSLNWQGQEIDGSSSGIITGDGRYIVFFSSGTNVIPGGNELEHTYLFIRDWQTGAINQLLQTVDGQPPNGLSQHPAASYDGRYIVYASSASNLVPNDLNGHSDIFYLDRQTGVQRRVTLGPNGEANGPSGRPQISGDGRYIVFHSEATNLVANDTNGVSDIFLYEMATGALRRISVAGNGAQSNGLSKEPSICHDGRFVSFTSAATNLVPGDVNGQRDVFVYGTANGQIRVVTANANGEWGNNIAHRSFMIPNCEMVAFASEADNLVPNDTNGERDAFMGDFIWPADLGLSYHLFPLTAEPGQSILYQVIVENDGHETASASLTSPIPANTTYVVGSGTAGVVYNAALNRIEWTGDVLPGVSRQVTYQVTVDPNLLDPTAIVFESTLTGDGATYVLRNAMIVFGYQTFLPMNWLTD